ncbi:MAG: CoA transferase, partial [Chloroflexi bacterium]|nr:CoA transferase [Chloroflexota bacterium]
MASPLEGVSVVDLSRGMAGAIATMLLADYGASVLQVGHPRGDPFQTLPAMHVWNRGKKSITLDLGRPQAKGVLFRLLDTADVLLETFQPGYLARLGLDYPSLRERYPRLVYCSLTGYGQEGPERDRPAYDGLVQARAGLQGQRWGAQGGHRTGPLYMAFAAPSYAGGFLACVGILTALHVRELTGLGQQVDTSLADASRAMSRWSWAERVPPSATRGPARSMVRVFRCADGEHLWAHTGARGAFERLMKALGMEEFVG